MKIKKEIYLLILIASGIVWGYYILDKNHRYNDFLKVKKRVSQQRIKNLATHLVWLMDKNDIETYPKDLQIFSNSDIEFLHPNRNQLFSFLEVLEGKADYLCLLKEGDKIEGESSRVIFMEKIGMWDDDLVYVLHENFTISEAKGKSIQEVLDYVKNKKK